MYQILVSLQSLITNRIMHHLHKLRKHSTDLACQALDELLSLRLFAEEKEDWIERASMMRIWISTSSGESKDSAGLLRNVLDTISSNTKKPFSAAATHAAQMVPRPKSSDMGISKLNCSSSFGSRSNPHTPRSNTNLLSLGAIFQTTLFLKNVENSIVPGS
jgi:hypothetical protein